MREGSIVRASAALHLTPQTISGQLKLLDQTVGEPLFERVGRRLVLTDTGHVVFQYAEEIFALGAELAQRVRGGSPGRLVAFNVGIVNSIPKLIAYRILRPALSLPDDPIRVACYEGDYEKLLGDLAVHRLDLVLADRPVPPGLNIKAYHHRLGETPVALFAQRDIAGKYTRGFPQSLSGAPLLLPMKTTALRRALDEWFDRIEVVPSIVAEFDDSALIKAFGHAAIGIFPAPLAIAAEVERMYNAHTIGVVADVTESYFAVSAERRLKHPAVLSITSKAREQLFPDQS